MPTRPPRKKSTVRKINPPTPTPKQKKEAAENQKAENTRIRHAIHGSAIGENRHGVTIMSATGGGIPQKPKVVSKKR